MLKLWGYSVAIFMAILLLLVNFAPKGKIEEVKTVEKSQQVKNDDLKVELKDGIGFGKYYTDKGYYIIVWDEDYNKPIEYNIDISEWEYMDFGEIY